MKKQYNPQCKIRCVETGEVFENMTALSIKIGRGTSAISQAIKRGGKCAGYHYEKIVEKEFAIYKLTLPNGKVYIGQTNTLLSRRWGCGRGYKGNEALAADIEAFGWESVKHEVLERVDTREEALARERYYILEHKSNDPDFGYNIATNLSSFGTPEEIAQHRRAYSREYNNVKNPHKTVICVETGIEYESAMEAARQLGLNPSHISSVCRGNEGRYTCGGYHWEYGRVI